MRHQDVPPDKRGRRVMNNICDIVLRIKVVNGRTSNLLSGYHTHIDQLRCDNFCKI